MFWRTVFIDLSLFLLCLYFRQTSKKSQAKR
nr:MAG TPA: hypothetical protein [Caudoviricetes sp.]DAX88274.1 MAG TPA: hypothetical protein [Caudoviricetes sp.]